MFIPYVELHNHTYYSPLDGLSSPEEYCERAKAIGIDTIAITDHGTVAGHRHFQRATTDAGIKPVLGVEAYISETDRFDKRSKTTRQDGTGVYNHIILLAKNNEGVKAINRLSEIGWTEGFYTKPRIDFETLSAHGDDLIVLSGCMSGLVARNLLNGKYDEARDWTRRFKERFDEDFYMEIQTHNHANLNRELLQYADEYGIKPVVTGDCHYADPEDKEFEEAFLVLGTNPKKAKDLDMSKADKMNLMDRINYLYPDRFMTFKDIDVFLESAENRYNELLNMDIDRTDVFSNTLEIADKIQPYEYKKDEYTLPVFPDKNVNEGIRDVCERGLKMRGLAGKQEYIDRMEEELKVILDKDLAIYFVILWDALAFCRREGIAYGAGRGSAAGSLVCYLMQITEVDPIEHNLLFWRFLDPERSDMPDIDTDIQDTRRLEVKQYLATKYGSDKVASVSTLTTYKGRSAIKAACRIMGINIAVSDKVVSYMTDLTGDSEATSKNLAEYVAEPELKSFREKYPDVLRIATKIADRVNGYGIHPGGVVITNEPISNYTGVETRKPTKHPLRQNVTAMNGDDCAERGLVKYDFLGLSNLSVVADAIRFIKDNHGRVIDWKGLKEDDSRVLDMISQGHTVGIFQSDAEASTRIITDLGIDTFNDLVVSNALVRPGAWEAFGKEFIARKKGYKKTTYPTADSQRYLGDTYGFYLYQEQTMLVCTEIAGMSKSDANKVRKLTAKKKDATELLPFRESFFDGALSQVNQKAAEKLWADIELTAKYSFNKCLAKDTTVEVMFGEIPNTKIEIMTVERLYAQMRLVGNDVQFYVKGPKFINGAKVGETVWHQVKTIHNNGVRDIWRIWIDSKTYIDSTENHKHRLSKCWKEARRIHQNDQIWTSEGKKKVWKRSFEGQAQTYDLELYDEPHAFYANGFLTHNSHAVAYSKLSYTTAWLKYHYPEEFMAALLNNESDTGNISKYLAECKRLGIRVELPNVNKSNIEYSCSDKVIYMGLGNIKGIGPKKAEHILHHRPYRSYKHLCEKVAERGSGLDKTVLEAMDAVGALRFADHEVDEDVVKNNLYEYLGIPSFDSGLISAQMQQHLTKLEDVEDTGVVVVAGIVKEIVSKNNWIRVGIVDETGTTSFFVSEGHGLVKGNKYLMVLADKSLIMSMDMQEYTSEHPIVKYLKMPDDQPGTYAVAAKARKTKAGKQMATLVYSRNGVLKSCVAFENSLGMAREGFALGERIRIATKQGKMGEILEGVKLYGSE